MATGIKVENASNVRIIDCGFYGLDVAVDLLDSSDIRLERVGVFDTPVAVRGRGVQRLHATDVVHQERHPLHLKPIAYLIRRAIHGYV